MSQSIVESFKVLSTLSAYRIVALDTANADTVVIPGNNQRTPIGITVDTVKDTTGAIAVQICGIAKLYMQDTCSAGSLICADAGGLGGGIKYTDNTAGGYVLGQVMQNVAATGTLAKVLIQPFWKIIT